MGETPPGGPKIDVEAPKFVAFIGTIVMILEGIMYLRAYTVSVWYIITGIVCLAGGVILLLILGIGFEVNTPIPYEWWLILAIGGGVITLEIITQVILTGGIFGIPWYLGALLVGIAGLLEIPSVKDKADWPASKIVLLIGSTIVITISAIALARTGTYVMPIIGIVLGVLLILTIFDVLPLEWWLVLILGSAAFILIHANGGSVILVGFILFVLDY